MNSLVSRLADYSVLPTVLRFAPRAATAGVTLFLLAGCSGFHGPDTRMGKPRPKLLSSRGVIPPPGNIESTSVQTTDSTVPTLPPEPGFPDSPDSLMPTIEPIPSDDGGMLPPEDGTMDDSSPDLADDTSPELPPAPEPAAANTHKVRKGESLWSIGRKYGVSMDELAAYNDMSKDDMLRAGKTLDIPPGATKTPDDVSPDTNDVAPSQPGTRGGSSAENLTPSGKQEIPADGKYIVQSGDSLWKISRRFGVSIKDLREWNDLDSDVLQIGRALLLRSPDQFGEPPRDTNNTDVGPINPPEDPIAPAPPENNGGDESETGLDDVAGDNADTATTEPAPVAFPQTLEHTVSPGETLESIATMYETSAQAIKDANSGIQSNQDLQPAQTLVIPFE